MKSKFLFKAFRHVLVPTAIAAVLAGNSAQAVTFNLSFSGGVNTAVGGGACASALNSSCRFSNVIQGAGTGTYQRDAIVTLSKANGGASLGTTFDNDAVTYTDINGTAIAGAHAEVFAPTVTQTSAINTTGWVEFTVQFVTPGTTTVNALPGTFFITGYDTDGNPTATDTDRLREFVEYVGAAATGLASTTSEVVGAAVDGGSNYIVKASNIGVNGITDDAQFKVSAQYNNVSSFKFAVGAKQGAVVCGTACARLSLYSFQLVDSVLTATSVDGYKSVKLTTDADGSGNISPGDTLTYTVTYANTGNAAVSNFQISDALPIGLTATAGAQTVRLNGTVTAIAKNALYTGATGNTNLLAASQTLTAGGTVSVDIPVTVGTVADNSTLSNQASATVGGVSVNSDNVDTTSTFPPSVLAATGFGTVPSGSVTQTQAATVDGTTVTVRRLPTLTLRKISNGGAGAFSFSGTNGFANQTITTTIAGTAVSGATQVLSAASTATTISEIIPSGYVLASASCTGLGSGGTVTFTPGTNNFTLNAAATAAGSAITCTVTNTKSPTISLQKAFGGTGRVVATDQFRLDIGGTNLTTTGTGSSVTSAAVSLSPAVAGTAYTLSETGAGTPAANLGNYTTTYACTNTLTGGQTPSGSAASFSVTPVAGDVLSCTFTNTPVPVLTDLSISKTGPASLVVGEVGSYTLKVWNQGPSPVTGATIADAVPAGLSGVSWTCTASGLLTACGTASGSGNAISFASGLLPVNTNPGAAGQTNPAPTSGDYLTITVTGTATTAGDLTNTATVTAPGGVTDGFTANNTASQATRIVPLPFTPTTPAVCSTLPGFTGIGSNLVTAFNNGTFGTSTGDPLVAGSIVRSPTGWAYLPANIPNYGYVQVGGSQPQDGSLSLVSRMSDPRVFGVWSNTLTPITVNASGAATSDVTSGRFLLINGANQGQSIIETTITGLTANTNYQLTGIFANVIDSGGNQVLPNLNFNISGASYYKTGPVPQDNNGNAPTSANQAKWRQAGFVFNSGAATSITFQMVSNVPAANGNDFAFDQLGLNQCQGTYVNTLSGFLYSDNNGNASFQNPAEPQLPAGVKVDLQYLDPNGNPVTVAKTTTGLVSGASNTGKYVFTNVPPPPTGFTYFVHVEDGTVAGEPTTIPTGYTLSTVNNAAIASPPNYVSGTNVGPDFGFTVLQPPVVTLLKLGRNVTKNTAFIAGTGSIGVLPGEVVEYCLVYSNTGGAAPNFKITDNVPAGVDAQLGAYAAGKGIRWAAGTALALPANANTGTPAGVDLTSAADTDQGTLNTTGGTNAKGVMTFDLGAAGLAANGKGTVCFQTKVP